MKTWSGLKRCSGKLVGGAGAAGTAIMKLISWIVLLLIVMNPAACEESKDAPGCGGGIGCGLGGCTGTRAIRDLDYRGPSCLEVGANDCTSIELEIYNRCTSEAQIGGQTIAADGRYNGFTVVKLPDGSFSLGGSPGSPDQPEDEDITLIGTVGTETVTITMFVTGDQC